MQVRKQYIAVFALERGSKGYVNQVSCMHLSKGKNMVYQS